METLDFGTAGAALTSVVAGVREDALDRPTPCTDWSVRELLAHVDGLLLAFRAAADKDLGPLTDTDPSRQALVLDEGWRERIPERVDALVRAWSAPEAWTGTTRAGGLELPAEVAGLVALDEVTLHGWDLARATGQEHRVDEATTKVVLGFATQTAEEQSPIFGPRVPVPDDASDFDRALGLAGRDPAWARP
ncbi:TIGR03086 family metal-binding protein [Georgenia halophila]|uniref:TIGR03086 family metal-binding protein n=1 Tax=Georgenia halophila TaxID=620889 RepID=A0ABP8LED2_9MICO